MFKWCRLDGIDRAGKRGAWFARAAGSAATAAQAAAARPSAHRPPAPRRGTAARINFYFDPQRRRGFLVELKCPREQRG